MNKQCAACRMLKDDAPALGHAELEPGLNAAKCSDCGGVFLEHAAYEQWVKSASGSAAADTAGGGAPDGGAESLKPSAEIRGAKFCPQCASYLVKYDVGADVDFTVDRCGRCGGMWLDGNEWNQLKARKLHAELHNVFSQNWQSKVRMDEHAKALEEIWKEQFGADYAELVRIKKWLESHPKAPEMYAFLKPDADREKSYAYER